MNHASPSRGELSRSEILHAAHDLFIKQGYHGTSMRQIAQHANLALGGLYNHFSSKEQVFEAVFLTFHPYHQVLPLIASARGDNLEQVVRDAIGHIARAVEGRQDFMNLMFIELVDHAAFGFRLSSTNPSHPRADGITHVSGFFLRIFPD
jgi:AcrR family transcriptional regulator